MAPTQVNKILKVYKSIAQHPTLTGAKIVQTSENGTTVQSNWTQRNLERHNKQKFSKFHFLNGDFQLANESFPIDVTTELASTFSKDGERRAVLRQVTEDNSTKQFIEIWEKHCVVKNYDLAALDVHGEVYTDAEFSAFKWSPDKTKLLYIAEKKDPKSEPFYKQTSQDKKEKEKKDENKAAPGNEYLYKPDWGEQLVGKHHPIVAVLDTTTDLINVLPGIPEDLSPGQVSWTPNGSDVVGVTFKHEPRHLGLVACTNRDSWVFHLKDGEFKKLSENGNAVHSPRFSPDGKYLIWLEREAGGLHHNCHRLMAMTWESSPGKVEVVIDRVETQTTINVSTKQHLSQKNFFGLYNYSLPERCWSKDSRYLFLSTPQKANIRSYIINIEEKTVIEIENDSSSLVILDVVDSVIAFLRTSLIEPSILLLGRFDPENALLGQIARFEVTPLKPLENFKDIQYEPVDYTYDSSEDVKTFNYIYFGPKDGKEKSIPLVVVAHGGPHSAYSNIFSLDYTLMISLGFGVVQVNYRGSTGMGQKTVEYLQGKVGVNDVKDCMTATQDALKKYPWLDPARIGLYGGSHGGFLVTHLSGQYSDMFSAVVARNPVINIAAMFVTSDIPDWCASAIARPYDEVKKSLSGPACEEVLLKMYNCSPIVHVNNVKAPTLLCIGKNDLRVPPSQGKLWYHRLKENNVKTKMLVYDDNHSLGSGPSEIDNIINAMIWLMEHTSSETQATA
ncbi:acylamino-acid-releasing enzyme [Orussus abietinus]|uniref:acylamino-acid-releasing enzyme n=1 Tax=Orussus abietinus TaxID=222816 RepID=UPI000626EAF1|nr:acylamino-acid-releasing enzyme [Orussus abietinus]